MEESGKMNTTPPSLRFRHSTSRRIRPALPSPRKSRPPVYWVRMITAAFSAALTSDRGLRRGDSAGRLPVGMACPGHFHCRGDGSTGTSLRWPGIAGCVANADFSAGLGITRGQRTHERETLGGHRPDFHSTLHSPHFSLSAKTKSWHQVRLGSLAFGGTANWRWLGMTS